MAKVLEGTEALTASRVSFPTRGYPAFAPRFRCPVRTLGGVEVDDVAILLEHVDLLNGLDGLSVELLQGLEELLVVSTGAGRATLGRATGSTLATVEEYYISKLHSIDSVTRVGVFIVVGIRIARGDEMLTLRH